MSVRLFVDDDELKAHYKITLGIRPGPDQPQYFQKIRFREGAAVVKHTPSRKDKYHHDVYQSDEFVLIEHIEFIGHAEELASCFQ